MDKNWSKRRKEIERIDVKGKDKEDFRMVEIKDEVFMEWKELDIEIVNEENEGIGVEGKEELILKRKG